MKLIISLENSDSNNNNNINNKENIKKDNCKTFILLIFYTYSCKSTSNLYVNKL